MNHIDAIMKQIRKSLSERGRDMNHIDAIIERVRKSLSERSFEHLGPILLRARKASRTTWSRWLTHSWEGHRAASELLEMVWVLADQAIAVRLGR